MYRSCFTRTASLFILTSLAIFLVGCPQVTPPASLVTVPNLSELTQAEAAASLANANLVLGTVTMESSETVPAGQVIRQDPLADTEADLESAVNLVISTGSGLTALTPNLIGIPQADALTALTTAGLVAGTISQEYSATVSAGNVISQNPGVGVSVSPGSSVALVISRGAQTVTVPEVTGVAQAFAEAAIRNSGLTVGTVTQEFNATVSAGSVLRQTPTAGSIVAYGSAVSLVVSISEAPQPMLTITPSVREVNLSAGTTSFDVSTTSAGSISWTASVILGSWIRISSGSSGINNGTITVAYDANASTNLREATIQVKISGTDYTYLVYVRQGLMQPELTVTPDQRDVTATAGATTFDVSNTGTGTMDWTAKVVSGTGSWLRISSGTSGTNSGTITVAYDENTSTTSRKGSIEVTVPGMVGMSKTIFVEQARMKPVLTVTPDQLNVKYDSGTTTFDVSNTGNGTMDWTAAVTSGSWLRISSGSSGTNSGTIKVAFDANTTTSIRTGIIQISTLPYIGAPKEVFVVQARMNPVLLVTPDQRNVLDSAGTTTFDVSNTGDGTMEWTAAVTSGSWLRISSGSSGTNSGTITVAYDDNTTTESRTGTILLTALPFVTTQKEIFVVQERKPLPSVMSFAINKGTPTTITNKVTLDNSCTGDPTYYMASESPTFSGASWQPYSAVSSFTLSLVPGVKTVYFKVKHVGGESTIASDTINLNPGGYILDRLIPETQHSWDYAYPNKIAADGLGNVYILDVINNRIEKYLQGGVFIDTWPYTPGAGDGLLAYSIGIAADSYGAIYIADTNNHIVQKFTSDGTFMMQWGSKGIGVGQFQYPNGIAVDEFDCVYVADTINCRIQKFTSEGDFVGAFGSRGSGNGQFVSPKSVAVDGGGNIYVADTLNYRIQKFNSSGDYLTQWGSQGTKEDTQFSNPAEVAVDNKGHVVVLDRDNFYLKSFSLAGVFQHKWKYDDAHLPTGLAVNTWGYLCVTYPTDHGVRCYDVTDTTSYYNWYCQWSGDGQIKGPGAVSCDQYGNVYVADTDSSSILRYDENGNLLSAWGGEGPKSFMHPYGIAADTFGNVYIADTGNNCVRRYRQNGVYLGSFGTEGSVESQFKTPYGIAVDTSGDIYVADSGNNRIQKFAGDGTYLTQWGRLGTTDGLLFYPCGITVDAAGYVYVADTGNNRIQKFAPNGVFVKSWGTIGTGDGEFNQPSGIFVDTTGHVYVADTGNNRIQKFTSDGVYLTQLGSLGPNSYQFISPYGVTVDNSGYLYVADYKNIRVKKFMPERMK